MQTIVEDQVVSCAKTVSVEREKWFEENARLLKTALTDASEGLKEIGEKSRVVAVARMFLEETDFEFDEALFATRVATAQEVSCWTERELGALKSAVQWVLLERIKAPEQADDQLQRLGGCLRKSSDAPWNELIEDISESHRILQSDPAGAYTAMDRDSRDLYRWRIAELAQRSEWSESDIAREAVRLAGEARERLEPGRSAERRGHVGFYLLDKGRDTLERAIGYRPTTADRLRRLVLRHPTPVYLGAIGLATLAVTGFILSGVGSIGVWWPAVLLLLLPASQAATTIVNCLVTRLIRPRVLPKLDFSDGIPEQCTTMVAVPSLLLDAAQVRNLVRDLEIRYVGNQDPNLYFALLTDSPDASKQFDERDELAALTASLIENLNQRYGTLGRDPFLLLHRHRVYNESEGAWMGWERKRGKLLDLNNLLEDRFDSFPVKVGDLSVLPRVRYVITLDADTQLPRDAARRLVETIAHPLNRAVVDQSTNTVVEGYAIIQPRIGISIDSATRSRLAAIFSGETGFDTYTRAVSEVYQDLFGEATFTGKGIYEVATFQQVLLHRFPCNALLSHDLIEGAYARVGLASGIELIDDYPTRFSAYCRRKHRWARGDWQTVCWLLPWVPDVSGHWTPNPISAVSRWKIVDNLRRSLADAALFALLLCGWLWLPGGAFTWTVAVLVSLALPSYVSLLVSAAQLPFARDRRAAGMGAADSFLTDQFNIFFALAFLSHQTLVMLDAVGRTVVRLTVTHRKLLEWETAAEAEMGVRKRTPVEVFLDWTPWLSGALLGTVAILQPAATAGALPVLLIWAGLKPLCAWLDRSAPIPRTILRKSELDFLRDMALHTWGYFRELSTETENWLIPDNFQEDPGRVAHRISPTNLGLLLNARLAASELGFITQREFADQTRATFRTMRRMDRFHGHFLNWYDTRTLEPLAPRFVSTVDSGNLAASLWALQQALDKIGLHELAAEAGQLVDEMDFRFLYNTRRKLLSIGWDRDTDQLHGSCYDLLASEARTAHFVALAKGDVPLESWRHLGRTHMFCHKRPTLLSWTGTMFEYLMPFLWMRYYPNTLLGQAAAGAVHVQQITAAEKRLPWGVSEAACTAKNQEGDYEYGPVGIPELALSPDASERDDRFLVAPYATFLALPIDAAAAFVNLLDLKARGCLGRYGFYEAIEFSQGTADIVRSWMAHHQGMSLVAACNALTGGVIRDYFHSNPAVAATELMLQEKMPLIVNTESEDHASKNSLLPPMHVSAD